MTGLRGFLLFVGLSMALHAAFFLRPAQDGIMGSGDGGEAYASVSAGSDEMQAMVERWTQPLPPPVPAPVQPVAPDTPSETVLPQTDAARAAETPAPIAPTDAPAELPALPDALPRQPSAPDAPTAPQAPAEDETPARIAQPDTPPRPEQTPDTLEQPQSPLAARQSPRPAQRPAERPPAQAAAPSPATGLGLLAAGSGGGERRGSGAQADGSSLSETQRSTLLGQWGGQIQARIEQRRPDVRSNGSVVLQLRIARNGTLESVGILQSSGRATLDDATLSAVRRIGRFPAAPDGLTDASYPFSLRVTYR